MDTDDRNPTEALERASRAACRATFTPEEHGRSCCCQWPEADPEGGCCAPGFRAVAAAVAGALGAAVGAAPAAPDA